MDGERSAGAAGSDVQRLLYNALQYARVRLELIELELACERQRIGSMLTRGMVLSLAALLTAQLLAALVIAAFWTTPWRLHAIVVIAAAAIALTAFAWRALRALRKEPGRPIAAALRDLDKLVAPPPTGGVR